MSVRNAVMNDLLSARLVSRSVRVRALRRMGMSLGDVRIGAAVTFSGTDVTIGDGSFLNYGCFIDGAGPVDIGMNCDFGQRVSIHTVTHDIGDASRRAGPQKVLATRIGDGTWVGAGVTILPGVTVGPGCVIAAGSVVTRDCEPNGLYAGVPARLIRSLSTDKVGPAMA